eukprot:gene9064-11102_t
MSFKIVTALLLVLFITGFTFASEAELLFQKKIVDGPVVGKELLIQFVIYNVGSEAAHDVSFEDTDFLDGTTFKVISGESKGNWEQILPSSKVSLNMTVIPNNQGIYPLTSTVLKYLKNSHTKEHSYLTAASYSGMFVESLQDYEKRTSLHIKEWATFFLLCLGSVAFPLSTWVYYKMNYKNGIKIEKSQ